MKLVYSITINIPPFKKQIGLRNTPQENYHTLGEEHQKAFILEVVDHLKTEIEGDWGHYVWELTKKGDQHYHGLVYFDVPITKKQWKDINTISAYYGTDNYNKCIYLEYCRDAGVHWRTKYMEKDQGTSPPNSPNDNRRDDIPIGVFALANARFADTMAKKDPKDR